MSQNEDPVQSPVQQIQLTPIDLSNTQSPSSQSHLIDRKYKGVMHEEQFILDGKTSHFKTGEFATIFKNVFLGHGGVNLTKIRFMVCGDLEGKALALAFHGPSEQMKDFTDVYFGLNSRYHKINGSTKGNKFPIEVVFPTALGMQIIPPDPVYLALHFSIAIEEGFLGSIQIQVTYDCDIIYTKNRGTFF